MKTLAVIGMLVLTMLTGCVPRGTLQEGSVYYTTFETPTKLDLRKLTIRITEPGWFRAPNVAWQHAKFVWVDSPSTSLEVYTRWALIPETTMNRRWSDLMPREQGEYFLAKRLTALLGNSGVLTDSKVDTVDWAGRPGFRVTASFTNAEGLDMKLVAYGASYDRYLYALSFESDAIGNYDKVLPVFEKIAKTAEIHSE